MYPANMRVLLSFDVNLLCTINSANSRSGSIILPLEKLLYLQHPLYPQTKYPNAFFARGWFLDSCGKLLDGRLCLRGNGSLGSARR